VNIESCVSSVCTRSRRRGLLAATGVTALLGTLASCHYGSNYSLPTIDVPNSIAIADVNGDGTPDLLVATTADQGNVHNPGFANVILGNHGSAGTFQTGVRYPTTGNDPSSIAVADLTHSGSLDLVVANFGAGSVSVFMHGASPGTYQTAVNVTTGGQPNQVVIGDINGDGKPDLVIADESGPGNAIVLFQDPANPGQFLAPMKLPINNNSTAAVAIGDLNGDGAPDIVAATFDANGNNGAIYIFYQNAVTRGTFLPAVTFPAGAQPQAVRIADVNGDGLPDIVVANLGPGTDGTGLAGVSVLLQDAAHPGRFLAPVTYATQAQAVDVAVADLNGDGKPDLVVANLGPAPTGSVSVLLQDPAHPGVFLSATSYAGLGQPLSVAIADLNGDGHPDIAVADGDSATVMLQSATSPGTFAQPVQVGN
jgi:FG-GAP-like repeat/FG-GAP repeat